mgnify:CR=1 FL=1
MSEKRLEEIGDRLEALEMLSQSILAEIKLVKEALEAENNGRAIFAGRRYTLSEL